MTNGDVEDIRMEYTRRMTFLEPVSRGNPEYFKEFVDNWTAAIDLIQKIRRFGAWAWTVGNRSIDSKPHPRIPRDFWLYEGTPYDHSGLETYGDRYTKAALHGAGASGLSHKILDA